MNKYQSIATNPLPPSIGYIHTNQLSEVIHLDDSAVSAMWDYKKTQAITIKNNASLSEANLEMKACHVHVLLVIDDKEQVIGLISSEDLLGEKPVKLSQEKGIPRADLKTKVIMKPQSELISLQYSEVKLAKVGHIIQTLKETKQHYALVIETNEETSEQQLRGLFSLSSISKQLTINMIDDDPLAQSLLELNKKIGE